jgi:putative methionine-R-sulfoxide reductase with GAF domain
MWLRLSPQSPDRSILSLCLSCLLRNISSLVEKIALKWARLAERPRRNRHRHRRQKQIVTDEKDKPVLDQQTFDTLLEAAYVIQEHQRKVRDAEERMESQSERLREREQEPAKRTPTTSAPIPENKAETEKGSRSDADYTLTLAEIVEAQRQIQARHLELDKAMAVVAESVARITCATGAGVGILEGKTVHYRARAGAPGLPLGTEIPLATAICAASVRTGQVIRSDDVNTEVLFDPEPCRERGILSLVAVPIYHDGDIIGALEIYFDKIHGYAEQDIHTCQLMAGLVTEAIGRDAESKLKKSMAAERSTMLAAIERLQPNLAALAAEDQSAAAIRADVGTSAIAVAKSPCWKCGGTLFAEEQFCGKCGAPRVSDTGPASLQSKVASAWHKQQTSHESLTAENLGAASHTSEAPRSNDTRNSHDGNIEVAKDNAIIRAPEVSSLPKLEKSAPLLAESLDEGAEEEARAEYRPSDSSSSQSLPSEAQHDGNEDRGGDENEDHVEERSTALTRPQAANEEIIWSSAAKAREFLESLSQTRSPNALGRFWRSRRGDFYLAIAVILMVVVIRWGIWSNHAVSATGSATTSGSTTRHKHSEPDADLSLLDRMLIGLGLAEAPDEAPEYKGNPDTQVWVDLHTALYYCPGSDLYGKTAKGKLSTQRQAQLDQFEPASRKACD